jgi:transcriptional regulatory protein RtcR
VTRMATLAPGGRINPAVVDEEIARLQAAWRRSPRAGGKAGSGDDLVARVLVERRAAALDAFDRVQLAEVLRLCNGARSLSEAGRALFAASRARRKSSNDADRLRKYLARFEIDWSELVKGEDEQGQRRGDVS